MILEVAYALDVASWSLLRKNLVETENQKQNLCNHIKQQVMSKYDALMKRSSGPKKDD